MHNACGNGHSDSGNGNANGRGAAVDYMPGHIARHAAWTATLAPHAGGADAWGSSHPREVVPAALDLGSVWEPVVLPGDEHAAPGLTGNSSAKAPSYDACFQGF